MSKVIVIGANFSGLTAAKLLLDGGCSVTIYEKQDEIGYMGAAFPMWIKGQVRDRDQLFYSNALVMEDAGAKVCTACEVQQIDFTAKSISVVDKFGRKFQDTYDFLILATGSRPRQYPVAGMDLEGIHYAKFFSDANTCVQRLASPALERVAIIGGGYIGCELAEACKKRGKEVVLYETASHILPSHFDKEFSQKMEQRLRALGVSVNFSRVRAFRGQESVEQVVHEYGTDDVQLVLFCVGFYPVADIGDDLERTNAGAYLVDAHQETNVKGVFAVGDCAANYHHNFKEYRSSFFASNAIRTATIAAKRILGMDAKNPGTQDSSAILIDGLYMGSVGISLREAKEQGIEIKVSDFDGKQFPAFMALNNPDVSLRLLYRKNDRVLVGAQIASEYDISSALNYYSLAVQEKVPIESLALMDLFFMPHFNHAYNYHMLCALGAS